MLAILGFVGTLALITGLIHFYLWKRLVKDTTGPGRWRRVGTVVALVLAVLVPATMAGTQIAGAFWLAWPGYLWLAVMFYLLIVLLALEVPMAVTRLVLRRRSAAAEATAVAPEPALVGAAGSADPPAAEAVDRPDHDESRRLLLARGPRSSPGSPPPASPGTGSAPHSARHSSTGYASRWPSSPQHGRPAHRHRLGHPPRPAARSGAHRADRRDDQPVGRRPGGGRR